VAVSNAKREAIARYDSKTYKKVLIALRIDEDADILESLQDAKDNGYSNREWLRQLFEGA
jgi:hypothetical protein